MPRAILFQPVGLMAGILSEDKVGVNSESGAAKAGRTAKSPTGFADIARRMTSRTTDLIAISIVAVASLTFGRQILEWWHAAPDSTPSAASHAPLIRPAWEDQLQPVALEFGDLPLSMTRQAMKGDGEAAVESLVRHCERAASAARSPWRERDAAEDQLLARTAGLEPAAQEPSVWQVYVVDMQFPMVAGVRQFASGPTEAARDVPRLVCWGMAMPAGQKAWNLYVFQAALQGNPVPAGLTDVPLPPDGSRNLSLRDERGGTLVGFSGRGSPPEWMKFYDEWFAGRGWSSGDGWMTGGGSWSARFQKPGTPGAGRVEVQFADAGNRELTGLLQIVPNQELGGIKSEEIE
jgi:hypothetical protein